MRFGVTAAKLLFSLFDIVLDSLFSVCLFDSVSWMLLNCKLTVRGLPLCVFTGGGVLRDSS